LNQAGYKYGAPTALNVTSIRKPEILLRANFSTARATSATVNDFFVSFSIDVIATFLIPHGTI